MTGGASAVQDAILVHMFWIGESMPQWVAACAKSYLDTGHQVNWWLYPQERKADFDSLKQVPELADLLKHKALHVCDASLIMPRSEANRFFYHGMGDEGKWAGWAPFSDWFRYEVLARMGGWWVDADGLSVRSLRGVSGHDEDVPIFCTERHRLDRRTVGAIAVEPPQTSAAVESVAGERQKLLGPGPSGGLGAFWQWVEQITDVGLEVCLVTNNHIYIPAHGTKMMRCLAEELKGLLDRYATEVQQRGVASVRSLTAAGRANCSLPTGNVGMLIFQRAVREELARTTAPGCGACKPQVMHWSCFNPIEATEGMRMHRILAGTEELLGKWIRTIHIFRQVRDDWKRHSLVMPAPLVPKVSDADPPPMEVKKRKEPQPAAPPPMVIREVAIEGPPLKRRRPVPGLASSGHR